MPSGQVWHVTYIQSMKVGKEKEQLPECHFQKNNHQGVMFASRTLSACCMSCNQASSATEPSRVPKPKLSSHFLMQIGLTSNCTYRRAIIISWLVCIHTCCREEKEIKSLEGCDLEDDALQKHVMFHPVWLTFVFAQHCVTPWARHVYRLVPWLTIGTFFARQSRKGCRTKRWKGGHVCQLVCGLPRW